MLVATHSLLMKTFLTSVTEASASGPSSRPRPDCFMPPNGVQYRTDECELTLRLPDSTPRATRSARPRSRVKIEPDSPYSVALAIAIASCSDENGSTARTGPNTSSVHTRSCGDSGTTTRGLDQNPGPSGTVASKVTAASP